MSYLVAILLMAGVFFFGAMLLCIDAWVRMAVRAYDRRTDKIRITVEQRR